MEKKIISILTLFVGALASFGQTQTSKDSLSLQQVTVVKPYTPSLSEAFKLKVTPNFTPKTSEKKGLDYSIFSVPVASVFIPEKSKSLELMSKSKNKTYNNLAALSLGNYTTISGDLFLNHELDNQKKIGAFISHNSSQGGISGVSLNDSFSSNGIEAFYNSYARESDLELKMSYKQMTTNWYGLSNTIPIDQIPNSDVKQRLSVLDVSTTYQLVDHWLEDLSFEAYSVTDRYDSKEYYFEAKSNFNYQWFGLPLQTALEVNTLKGTFSKSYSSANTLDFSNFMINLSPSYSLDVSQWRLSFGFGAYFFSDMASSKRQFFVVPDISARYQVVENIMVAYAGISGCLKQNTYLNLYSQNPFVSPTLNLKPTYTPYDVFLGTQSKLSNQVSIDLKAQFSRQVDALLFQKQAEPTTFGALAYSYGNSFDVLYDKINIFSLNASLEAYVSENLQLNGSVEYHSFNMDSETKPWNLPNLNADLLLYWSMLPKWELEVQAFYIGNRYELQSFESATVNPTVDSIVKLSDILDLNSSVYYDIHDRYRVFVKLNNLLGQNYQLWDQYPTQGFQISAGAYYKFDF